MGWAVEGNLKGRLLQVITITSLPTHTGKQRHSPKLGLDTNSSKHMFSPFYLHGLPTEEEVLEEEDEVMLRGILCKIHVGQAKLTSLTGAVKSIGYKYS